MIVPEPASNGRLKPQGEIETEVFAAVQKIPDVRAYKLNDRGDRDISYSILSDNDADLQEAVAALESNLRSDPLLAHVSAAGALPRPEVHIVPRFEEAARLGVTTQAIAETVRVATIGEGDASLAKLSVDNRLIRIRVQLDKDLRTDPLKLGALRVRTGSGDSVPLSAVADISVSHGPNTIDRLNRQRKVTIGADLPIGVALDTATAPFPRNRQCDEVAAGRSRLPNRATPKSSRKCW